MCIANNRPPGQEVRLIKQMSENSGSEGQCTIREGPNKPVGVGSIRRVWWEAAFFFL